MGFDRSKFEQIVRCRWVGARLDVLEEVGSTNTYLKEMLRSEPVASGTVAFTDYQSAGRGRRGRMWVAPPATSLLVSVLFRPKFSPQKATWFTMIAGLAAIEAVKQVAAIDVALKWPNDVMIQGDDGIWRKTGGILLEADLNGNALNYCIIGMGLNCNIEANDLPDAVTPATSLLASSGQRVDREALLAAWLLALERLVDSAELGVSPQPAWNDALITIGQPVTVSGAVNVEGVAVGTDAWGNLLVQDAAGTEHTVTAGDVTLRPHR